MYLGNPATTTATSRSTTNPDVSIAALRVPDQRVILWCTTDDRAGVATAREILAINAHAAISGSTPGSSIATGLREYLVGGAIQYGGGYHVSPEIRPGGFFAASCVTGCVEREHQHYCRAPVRGW